MGNAAQNVSSFDESVRDALSKSQDVDDDLDPDSTENDDVSEAVKLQPSAAINKLVMDTIEQIKALKADRSEINAKISAAIEILEAKGVNRHAFRYALKVYEMSPEQREGLDLSYMVCRKATGMGIQRDMFDTVEKANAH